MPSPTKFLDDAKASVDTAERQVKGLEIEQAKATSKVEELRGQLVALGFDPEGDMEEQIAAMEADTKTLLEGIDARVRELSDRLG